jgi:2-(1,2-epoxy-1,2-dihydrophenyl)acetyl-CoA isomerase
MAYETLLYDLAEGVATITLNRPERLNAVSRQLIEELGQAMAQAEADAAVRCVLLTGAGRGFCAGADLADPSRGETATRDAGAALDKYYNPTIRLMRAMPKPIVAAVNGVAAGAGMSFALAADIAIAAKSASFLQAFARIGLLPDAGSTWFLPRLVGDQRARALAMLAPQISAEQALAWGMIWQVVDDAELMDEARKLAKRLAAGPTLALGRIKQALNASAGNSLATQLDLERDLQRELGRSSDFAEGVAAFLQKRPAQFKGN